MLSPAISSSYRPNPNFLSFPTPILYWHTILIPILQAIVTSIFHTIPIQTFHAFQVPTSMFHTIPSPASNSTGNIIPTTLFLVPKDPFPLSSSYMWISPGTVSIYRILITQLMSLQHVPSSSSWCVHIVTGRIIENLRTLQISSIAHLSVACMLCIRFSLLLSTLYPLALG